MRVSPYTTPATPIQWSTPYPYLLSLNSHCSHLNSLPSYHMEFLSISAASLAASCHRPLHMLFSPFLCLYPFFVFCLNCRSLRKYSSDGIKSSYVFSWFHTFPLDGNALSCDFTFFFFSFINFCFSH